MGITTIKIKVKNPKDERRYLEEDLLIDSGAIYSVIPKSRLNQIGIKSNREQNFSLADGTLIKRQVGDAIFEFNGTRAPAPVIVGKKTDSLILGVISLEAMGLVFNPIERKIYPAKLRM